MKYEISASGNLGKTLKLYLSNENGIKIYEANRKIRINAKHLFYDLYLEYYGSKISKFKFIKLFFHEFHKSITQYPKLFWHYFFYRYEFSVELNIDAHIAEEIYFENKKDIWYSRLAQISGNYGNQIGFLNDINKFRFSTSQRVFILEIMDIESAEYSFNQKIDMNINKNKISSKIQVEKIDFGKTNFALFSDAHTSSPYFIISKNMLSQSRNLDVEMRTGWPTDRLFYNSDYYSSVQYPLKAIYEKGIMSTFSSNWYHFLVETLPLLITYKNKLIGIPYLYFDSTSLQIIQIIADLLKSDPIQLPPKRNIQIKSLFYIQDFRYKSNFDFTERKPDIELLRSFFNTDQNFNKVNQKRKIFLTRDKDLFRKTLNYPELHNYLIKKGFEVFEPSKLTFDDQKKLFMHTQVLISETGAGLTNMLFMPKNSKVIELKFGEFGGQIWKDFSLANQVEYYVNQMQVSRITGKAKVDIKQLDELLGTIL
jgi:hypothetical protein